MAAPVQPIKASFNCPRRPLEKTCYIDWLQLHSTTSKDSFCIKANTRFTLRLMSNLRLGTRQLTVAAGEQAEYGALAAPTHWAALRAAHAEVGSQPLSSIMVCLFNSARTHFQSQSD